ncbi:MAG: ecotin family protein, partial [Bacteroidota bacterium]
GCETSKKTSDMKNNNTSTVKMVDLDISMYPQPNNNVRHIIQIPINSNEQDKKVEIYISKVLEVDCNAHSLLGTIKSESVSGWGYKYYTFETNGHTRSTLMGCPDGSLTKKKVYSISELVRYNSKLPIVVYTPSGYEVHYKIWNRNNEEHTAKVQ